MSNDMVIVNTDVITFSDSQVDLIRRQIAKGATPDELELFLYQCKRTGLDPLAKQIYFQKFGGRMTIVTGIDGYRLIADMTGVYAGNDDAVFDGVVKQNNGSNEIVAPKKATVTVWKLVKGVRMPFSASAYWSEYYPEKRPAMWAKMPMTMLSKCAEAKALRKAFPANLSGIYTSEEMQQADTVSYEDITHGVKAGNGSKVQDDKQKKPTIKDEQVNWYESLNVVGKAAAQGKWVDALEGISRYKGNISRFKNAAKKIIEGGTENYALQKRDGMSKEEQRHQFVLRHQLYEAVRLYAEARDADKDEFDALKAVHDEAALFDKLPPMFAPIVLDNVEDIPSASESG